MENFLFLISHFSFFIEETSEGKSLPPAPASCLLLRLLPPLASNRFSFSIPNEK
jgi:hypothetical protein